MTGSPSLPFSKIAITYVEVAVIKPLAKHVV
jgi:hypothetical protein